MKKTLFTIPEVARYLRVDIEDINYEIDQRQLQTVAIGTKVRVTSDALQDFLTARNIPEYKPLLRWWLYAAIPTVVVAGIAAGINLPLAGL